MVSVNSYFCGAGLMDAGLIEAGIHINQAFELDKENEPCCTIDKITNLDETN